MSVVDEEVVPPSDNETSDCENELLPGARFSAESPRDSLAGGRPSVLHSLTSRSAVFSSEFSSEWMGFTHHQTWRFASGDIEIGV